MGYDENYIGANLKLRLMIFLYFDFVIPDAKPVPRMFMQACM